MNQETFEFEASLAAQPDHRFTRLSREEVARMYRRAQQAIIMRDYTNAVRARAVDALVHGPERYGLTEDQVERVLTAESVVAGYATCTCEEDKGQPWPNLPVAVYLAPVKRWAGGPPEIDAWYWDHNSF